ncbi:hypothetical protein AGMMS50262_03070 [Bacteroidia bacterium]|nr:hypothetical protein AGMMS50262_03070 [Bacteroidia bacterium]
MDLLKVRLSELEQFCESPLFQGFSVKPVSPLRVKSYLNNPRAHQEDVVLYLFVENSQVIAFRTILPDMLVFQGETIFFGWYSGTWVKPENRGQKLSVRLLNEVRNDWGNRLLFTNYAQVSEHCYLETQAFHLLKERTGMRFYLYPDFNQIYKGRKSYHKLKFFLPFLSVAVRSVSLFKSLLFPTKTTPDSYLELPALDEECRNHLRRFPVTFFNRKEAEIDWIIQYPWVTPAQDAGFVYPFSYSDVDFSLKIVKIYENNRFAGFFIYTNVNAKMKIIYHFIDDDKINLMVNIVGLLAKQQHIEYLTVLDPALAYLFKQNANYFAFAKSYTSHVYSALPVANDTNLLIFDGDGDNCFT